MSEEIPTFEFTAQMASGKVVRGTVQAHNAADAYQKAAKSGGTVTKLSKTTALSSPRKSNTARKLQIELLRQFAVMAEARVEAIQAISALRAGATNGQIKEALDQAAIQLRSGEPLGQCLRVGIPGLPENILALLDAGEKGGCLAATASHAVHQLEAEERISTSISSALIYPTFLVSAGLLASILMLTLVIPRFALLLGDQRENLTGLSWLVFKLGDVASQSFGLALLLPPLAIAIIIARAWRQDSNSWVTKVGQIIPFISKLSACRERERWCRVMSFALSSRIAIVEAVNLATSGLSDKQMRLRASETARELRVGSRVADAIEKMQLLEQSHLNLVRVGESSGALAEMFLRISSDAESELQERIKRAMIVFEQLVTVCISMLIGVIIYGLISSLTSVYEAVGQ